MKSIIVGTAGHIDHGKTALVKALTGIDADRLDEEKRRGITIDLGFAHLELTGSNGEPIRFGFVDVPGHERFVRNMLAGVGGIDLVLLVIAADEGIKPQTREHFDICRLLNVKHGITVLTKSDLVDSETLQVLRLEIDDFLRGSFLEHAPIVAVSSLKSTGLEELKRELVHAAMQIPSRNAAAITRLPIDRVFTIKGFGTVVTGTLVAGEIRKEDELELLPSRQRVRLRGVEVHGAATDRARAGERTAANLAGIEKSDIARGMLLATPGLLQPASRLDVRLSLLASAKPIKTGARVHLHAFTSEVVATVTLLESKQLQPGGQAFAHLRLSAPVPLFPLDRFIVRQFSPVITIGGGIVLDASPMTRLKGDARLAVMKASDTADQEQIIRARVARRGHEGIAVSGLVSETGWSAETVSQQLPQLKSSVVMIADRAVSLAAFTELKSQIVASLDSYHNQNSLSPGMQQQTLREQIAVVPELFAFTIRALADQKLIEIKGDLVTLSGRGVTMRDEEAESRHIIERAFASAGLKVPTLGDVLSGLKIDRTRSQKITTLLLREKTLIKISDDLVFHHSALDELRKTLAAEKLKSPKLDVARFKDITGVSRKYAIPLLEYLDRERITKRVGNERIVL